MYIHIYRSKSSKGSAANSWSPTATHHHKCRREVMQVTAKARHRKEWGRKREKNVMVHRVGGMRLRRWVLCCSMWQCVAVCCSVLQCVAVYCSVLQFDHRAGGMRLKRCVLCCSVLQCVAVCCGVITELGAWG